MKSGSVWFSSKKPYWSKVSFLKIVCTWKNQVIPKFAKTAHQFAAVRKGRFCKFLDKLILLSTSFKKTDFKKESFHKVPKCWGSFYRGNFLRYDWEFWADPLPALLLHIMKHNLQDQKHTKNHLFKHSTMLNSI